MVGRVFLGRYEATRLLGEGGMGKVYLARQTDLGRQVVVKVMHDHLAADPKFSERFQRETLLMARFQHPYAVTLYDASLNDPQGPCIVMEYIRGVTLDTMLQRAGRMSSTRIARLLNQLCEALQAAHMQGIVHRDLKPGNLMVIDADTPYEKLKVMDFGLAKLLGARTFKLSGSGPEFAIGTPGYICPEQARGEEVDHRGDLYSVGVILYEVLTGRLPFSGMSTMDVLLAHATEAPPSFAEIGANGWVPSAIEEVVRACMAKEPSQRPASARELADRYEAALFEPAEDDVSLRSDKTAAVITLGPKSNGQQAAAEVTEADVEIDPNVMVHRLEAWMPEAIASYKLRGFVHDAGGEIVESVPGLIRVRLGGRGSAYAGRGRGISWLLGRQSGQIEVELRLQRAERSRDSLLNITVLLRSLGADDDLSWRDRGGQIYCDLRAYLMGTA